MWDIKFKIQKGEIYAKCRNLKVVKFRVQVVAYNMHIFELYMQWTQMRANNISVLPHFNCDWATHNNNKKNNFHFILNILNILNDGSIPSRMLPNEIYQPSIRLGEFEEWIQLHYLKVVFFLFKNKNVL